MPELPEVETSVQAIQEFTSQNLESIGSKLGADVPFFINGGAQLGEGIGDQLTPIKHKFNQKFLIVLPNISIETSWAYSKIKTTLDKSKKFVNLHDCLKKKETSFENFDNDFEKIIIPAYDIVNNKISFGNGKDSITTKAI